MKRRLHPAAHFMLALLYAVLITVLGAQTASASGIINAHEHIQSFNEAGKLLNVMDAANISKTALLGSSKQTIYLRGGFVGYDENNEELLKTKEAYPQRFYVFCAISQDDEDNLEKLKRCIGEGGDGLKLYSGHKLFYTKRLDDRGMYPVYEYVEKNKVSVIWHVNPYYYKEEFENVLRDFPNMVVVCPHFCMSSVNTTRLRYLLDTYPNLYTDASFGSPPFLIEGLQRISKNPETYRNIFRDYGDRILFGTDMVVTDYEMKSEEWLVNVTNCYKEMLQKKRYKCPLTRKTLNGIGLNGAALEKVYSGNFEGLLKKAGSGSNSRCASRMQRLLARIGLAKRCA